MQGKNFFRKKFLPLHPFTKNFKLYYQILLQLFLETPRTFSATKGGEAVFVCECIRAITQMDSRDKVLSL